MFCIQDNTNHQYPLAYAIIPIPTHHQNEIRNGDKRRRSGKTNTSVIISNVCLDGDYYEYK